MPAVQALVERTTANESLRVDATIDLARERGDADARARLAPDLESTVYRLVQEGLRNVVRHADASQVALAVTEQDGFVHVCIQDDGNGFDPGRAGRRLRRARDARAGGSAGRDDHRPVEPGLRDHARGGVPGAAGRRAGRRGAGRRGVGAGRDLTASSRARAWATTDAGQTYSSLSSRPWTGSGASGRSRRRSASSRASRCRLRSASRSSRWALNRAVWASPWPGRPSWRQVSARARCWRRPGARAARPRPGDRRDGVDPHHGCGGRRRLGARLLPNTVGDAAGHRRSPW